MPKKKNKKFMTTDKGWPWISDEILLSLNHSIPPSFFQKNPLLDKKRTFYYSTVNLLKNEPWDQNALELKMKEEKAATKELNLNDKRDFSFF